MIVLDTNIVVRYLAQDDPIQSPKATQIIEHRLTKYGPGFISLVTMAETVWVRFTRPCLTKFRKARHEALSGPSLPILVRQCVRFIGVVFVCSPIAGQEDTEIMSRKC
jgi:predicted nucleic acid-binding protein